MTDLRGFSNWFVLQPAPACQFRLFSFYPRCRYTQPTVILLVIKIFTYNIKILRYSLIFTKKLIFQYLLKFIFSTTPARPAGRWPEKTRAPAGF
jgi:hypothetical protein